MTCESKICHLYSPLIIAHYVATFACSFKRMLSHPSLVQIAFTLSITYLGKGSGVLRASSLLSLYDIIIISYVTYFVYRI